MDNDITILIDQYLRGEMSAEEEIRFKQEIENNSNLKQQVKDHLLLVKGVRQVMKQKDEDIIRSASSNSTKTIVKLSWIKLTSIAAVIALCIVVGHDAFYTISANRYAQQLSVSIQNDCLVYTTRSAGDEEISKEIAVLFANVSSKEDLENTIAKLSKLYTLSRDEYVDYVDDFTTQIGIQLAIAYMHIGDYNAAVNALECVVEDNPNAKDAQVLMRKIKSIFFAKF